MHRDADLNASIIEICYRVSVVRNTRRHATRLWYRTVRSALRCASIYLQRPTGPTCMMQPPLSRLTVMHVASERRRQAKLYVATRRERISFVCVEEIAVYGIEEVIDTDSERKRCAEAQFQRATRLYIHHAIRPC